MFAITRYLSVISVAFLFYFLLFSCTDGRSKPHADISLESINQGKALAVKYCQSCHLLPDPSWLDSKSWEKGVLPNMGPRLGIFKFNDRAYPYSKFDLNIDSNFYPKHPLVNEKEWQDIINYYMGTSPDTLIASKKNDQPIQNGLKLFSVETPAFSYSKPATSLVKIDSISPHRLLVSDAIKQTIYRFNSELKLTDSIKTNGPIVDVESHHDSLLACNIGVLNPNTGKFGKGEYIYRSSTGKMKESEEPLFGDLRRPVQITKADLNQDGRQDYLVCEFGFLQGSLSWMEGTEDGKFTRHVIRPLTGAIKAYLQDYNGDGLQDIWVLFAQGEEGIFLFTNKGKGQFQQEEVLRFPPVYGSSYFELADFNKDGYQDIVYTCGDNADFSVILKPYHGVYIFLNDGKNHFNQQYFFHINGCFKAIARDYDRDGDLDIAAISNFADYNNRPEEGFVYLKNDGNFKFSPYTLGEGEIGRWLTMDAGDVDGDGRTDLVLGNFSIGPTAMKPKYDWKKAPPFILLKNTRK